MSRTRNTADAAPRNADTVAEAMGATPVKKPTLTPEAEATLVRIQNMLTAIFTAVLASNAPNRAYILADSVGALAGDTRAAGSMTAHIKAIGLADKVRATHNEVRRVSGALFGAARANDAFADTGAQ